MRAARLSPGFVSATFLTLRLMIPVHAKQTNVQRGVQTVVFQSFFESWLHAGQVGKPFSSKFPTRISLAAVQVWEVALSIPEGSDVSLPLSIL